MCSGSKCGLRPRLDLPRRQFALTTGPHYLGHFSFGGGGIAVTPLSRARLGSTPVWPFVLTNAFYRKCYPAVKDKM